MTKEQDNILNCGEKIQLSLDKSMQGLNGSIQTAMQDVAKVIADLKVYNTLLVGMVREKDDAIAKYQQELTNSQAKISVLEKNASDYKDKLEKYGKLQEASLLIINKEKELKDFESVLKGVEKELNNQIKEFNEVKDNIISERNDALRKAAEADNAKQVAIKSRDVAVTEKNQFEKDLNQAKTDLETTKTNLENDIKGLLSQIQKLKTDFKSERDGLSDENKNLKSNKEGLEGKIAELKEQIKTLEKDKKGLETEKENLLQEIQSLESSRNDLPNESGTLFADEEKQSEIKVIENQDTTVLLGEQVTGINQYEGNNTIPATKSIDAQGNKLEETNRSQQQSSIRSNVDQEKVKKPGKVPKVTAK